MRLSRRTIYNSLTALLLLAVIGGFDPTLPAAAQAENSQAKVDAEVLESLQGGKSADFIIVMAEQADLSAAYSIADWDERGWYVYNTLKETAARTQKRSIAELKRRGVRSESFFAGNEIYVHAGSEQALNAILALGDAGQVRAPVTVQLEPVSMFSQPFGPELPKPNLQAEAKSAATWGLTDTGAPNFWSTFNRKGQGIIVASIDSGVQYDHPALADAYLCAGSNLGDKKCWNDVTDFPTTVPYDGLGHGTHTMGTMVGTTVSITGNKYRIGMAPGAQWIACRAFAANNADDPKLLECADWILAPDNDPGNRPYIVNNSWSGKTNDLWFDTAVDAWVAAGIFPVFSAGNLGSPTTCSNIYSPSDYPDTMTAAAHDSSGNIANFSSKGPLASYYGQPPYLKPNISAPGVYILSSFPIDSYTYYSGTSMAAPHVSGAAALLWSCNPYLVGKISLTASILENSARGKLDATCGVSPDGNGNYTYGHGYLDVYQAGIMGCGLAPAAYLPIIMR